MSIIFRLTGWQVDASDNFVPPQDALPSFMLAAQSSENIFRLYAMFDVIEKGKVFLKNICLDICRVWNAPEYAAVLDQLLAQLPPGLIRKIVRFLTKSWKLPAVLYLSQATEQLSEFFPSLAPLLQFNTNELGRLTTGPRLTRLRRTAKRFNLEMAL